MPKAILPEGSVLSNIPKLKEKTKELLYLYKNNKTNPITYEKFADLFYKTYPEYEEDITCNILWSTIEILANENIITLKLDSEYIKEKAILFLN